MKPAPHRSTGRSSKTSVTDKISNGPPANIALIQKHQEFEERDPDYVQPTTEHKEKYVEWDVHNRQAAVVPQRKYSPIVPFQVGMDVSQWQSESSNQFHPHAAQSVALRPVAGVKAMNNAINPNSFAWQLQEKVLMDNFSDGKL